MFVNLPKKKFTLSLLFTIIYFNNVQLSHAETESVAVKEISFEAEHTSKESSMEAYLLEVEHRNKQLTTANKELVIRNDVLKKERDFYLKEATIYKEIVEKMEVQKIQTVENRNHTHESQNNSMSGGESDVSYSALSYKPSSQYILAESTSAEKEGMNYTQTKDIDKERSEKDNYIKNLEDQLQLANMTLQTLQNRTSLNSLLPLEALLVRQEQQEETITKIQAENLTLKAEVGNLEKKTNSDPVEVADEMLRQITELETELTKLKEGVESGDNTEEKIRQIAMLQTALDRLAGGLDAEESARKNKEIEEKVTRISALERELERLNSIVNLEESARKNKEIEEKATRINALENELEKLRSGEELAEYGRKIQSLEKEIIKLLGIDVETSSGQTPVWLALDSDNFFHTHRLKAQLTASQQPLKNSMRLLKAEYDKIKGALTGISKMNLNSLEEIDPDDVATFDVVAQNVNRIKGVRLASAQECKRIFNETLEIYREFSEQKSQEIPGLTEYINLQNIYHWIVEKIPFKDFSDLMEDFTRIRLNFINLVKEKVRTFDDKAAAPYFKLINSLELEYQNLTLSGFIKRYTTPPNGADKDFNNSPFILLNQQTGMGKDFDACGFKTMTHRATGIVKPGLEENDPFKNFRKEVKDDPASYAHITENLIDLAENMHMMKYLNVQWKHLQDTFFDQNLVDAIRGCNLRNHESKPLLDTDIKTTLCSMLEKDFLQKPGVVHATTTKELDNKLRPSLSYENAEKWRGYSRPTLREDLIEIYTIYRALAKGAFTMHAKNPKIKEFHEE